MTKIEWIKITAVDNPVPDHTHGYELEIKTNAREKPIGIAIAGVHKQGADMILTDTLKNCLTSEYLDAAIKQAEWKYNV